MLLSNQPQAVKMRIKQPDLAAQLQRELMPVYLVSGDEPLQLMESADIIRQHCQGSGVTGREIYHVDNKSFDWNEILAESNSLSLFAERKLLEVRLSTSGPGKEGGAAIRALLEQPNPDNVLLITMAKIDRASQNSKWFKAIDKAGAVIQVWPLNGRDLHRWITQRLQNAGISADREAIELIMTRVEGNLLAARQEVERLALLAGSGTLSGPEAARLVADNARYNVFELGEKALAGNGESALRAMRALKAEGTDATVVLWSLNREVRRLCSLHAAANNGVNFGNACSALCIWKQQESLYRSALSRVSPSDSVSLLQRCSGIDRCIKGLATVDKWDQLERLLLSISR